MSQEHFYDIALTLIKGVGSVSGRKCLSMVGNAEAIFHESPRLLAQIPQVGSILSVGVKSADVLRRAEQELEFMQRNGVRSLSVMDAGYPPLLRVLSDAPLVLYYRGSVAFDSPRMYSVVGTRKVSSYGRQVTDSLVRGVHSLVSDAVVVSGLAYGVDIAAHRAALDCGAPTIGVLAHGLDRIYPSDHSREASLMVDHGGLLTEFMSGTQPERYNFVGRNRIIAGLTPATVVVESGKKGGSLITAEIALSYNRELFAFPGRVTDSQAEGCNRLIHSRKAEVLLDSKGFVDMMMWGGSPRSHISEPRLFVDLTAEEERVVSFFKEESEVHLNDLIESTNLAIYELSPILLELEFKGVIRSVAGGKYRLV